MCGSGHVFQPLMGVTVIIRSTPTDTEQGQPSLEQGHHEPVPPKDGQVLPGLGPDRLGLPCGDCGVAPLLVEQIGENPPCTLKAHGLCPPETSA